MVELTRTICQWQATARRLALRDPGRPDLAEQILHACSPDPHAHPDTPVSVQFSPKDAALIAARAPLGAWWMPVAPRWTLDRPRKRDDAGDAVAAAEAIIAAHQRRRHG